MGPAHAPSRDREGTYCGTYRFDGAGPGSRPALPLNGYRGALESLAALRACLPEVNTSRWRCNGRGLGPIEALGGPGWAGLGL
jgi:hypothetical protein